MTGCKRLHPAQDRNQQHGGNSNKQSVSTQAEERFQQLRKY